MRTLVIGHFFAVVFVVAAFYFPIAAGAVAGAADRERVASVLEGTSHRRLDAKSALRYFQLVTAFDTATNAVAAEAAAYAQGIEQLAAFDAEHAELFNLKPAKQYLYEHSMGRLYRLEVQAGTPPRVVRVLERKLTLDEGRAFLAAQGKRTDLIAKQQEAIVQISAQEEVASEALASLKSEFGVEQNVWADLYLLPGRTDVMLVQGRYPEQPAVPVVPTRSGEILAEQPAVPVVPIRSGEIRAEQPAVSVGPTKSVEIIAEQSAVPVVPTRSGEIPPDTVWVHGVNFNFPFGSNPVISRLIDTIGDLKSPAPHEQVYKSNEWGEETVPVADLAWLLKNGSFSVEGDNQLSVRARAFNGDLVARDSVAPALSNLLSAVRESGYYIAGFAQAKPTLTNGVLAVKIDVGRVGEVKVAFKGVTNEMGEASVDGKWYSGKQIKRRFNKSSSGKPFDYGALYNALSDANESQDLSVNTDVAVRQQKNEDGTFSRTADLMLEVQESNPIHGSVELGNDGSAQSGNWWLGASLRHQNLTRHDDVLSIEAQTSLEDSAFYAFSGSYTRPHYWLNGGALSIYGGYSELDINNLVQGIGVSGMGQYVGLRLSQRLLDSRDYQVELAVGQTFRYIEQTLDFGGVTFDSHDATVAPYYAQLSWQQKRLDALEGRSFAMLDISRNIGDWMGTSDDNEMQQMRVGADADYTITRVQLARLQALGGGDNSSSGLESRWTLFARGLAQFSDVPLVALEQLGVGGASTVRGYEERELLGDSGTFVSFEVRTPVFAGMLPMVSRWLDSDSEWQVLDRLQLVAFMDAGWLTVRRALPGEDRDSFLLSAGPGLRYAFSKHALLRLDWGCPLEETVESTHEGRGHLNFQLQF